MPLLRLFRASLNEAYDEALKRKKADASEETQLADLRARYPELADKVVVNPVPWPDAAASVQPLSVQLACHMSGMAYRG